MNEVLSTTEQTAAKVRAAREALEAAQVELREAQVELREVEAIERAETRKLNAAVFK